MIEGVIKEDYVHLYLSVEPVAQIGFCHPELVSGSHNPLIL
jgi:hypothetical protein